MGGKSCKKAKNDGWDNSYTETRLSSNKCDAEWEKVHGDKATFGMGSPFKSCARFGVMPGVIRCKVGFAGGTSTTSKGPTFKNPGDYVQAVQVEYDSSITNYNELVDVFWDEHDFINPTSYTDLKSTIFYHDSNQKMVAEGQLDAMERQYGQVATVILPFTTWVDATNEYQHERLQKNKEVMNIIGKHIKPTQMAHSHLAARLDGYQEGYGTTKQFDDEEPDLFIPENLADMIRSYTSDEPIQGTNNNKYHESDSGQFHSESNMDELQELGNNNNTLSDEAHEAISAATMTTPEESKTMQSSKTVPDSKLFLYSSDKQVQQTPTTTIKPFPGSAATLHHANISEQDWRDAHYDKSFYPPPPSAGSIASSTTTNNTHHEMESNRTLPPPQMIDSQYSATGSPMKSPQGRMMPSHSMMPMPSSQGVLRGMASSMYSDPMDSQFELPSQQQQSMSSQQMTPSISRGMPSQQTTPSESRGMSSQQMTPSESRGMPSQQMISSESRVMPSQQMTPSDSRGMSSQQMTPSESRGMPSQQMTPSESRGMSSQQMTPSESRGMPSQQMSLSESRGMPSQQQVMPSRQQMMTSQSQMPSQQQMMASQQKMPIPNSQSGMHGIASMMYSDPMDSQFGMPSLQQQPMSSQQMNPSQSGMPYQQQMMSSQQQMPSQQHMMPSQQQMMHSQQRMSSQQMMPSQQQMMASQQQMPSQQMMPSQQQMISQQQMSTASSQGGMRGMASLMYSDPMNSQFGIPFQQQQPMFSQQMNPSQAGMPSQQQMMPSQQQMMAPQQQMMSSQQVMAPQQQMPSQQMMPSQQGIQAQSSQQVQPFQFRSQQHGMGSMIYSDTMPSQYGVSPQSQGTQPPPVLSVQVQPILQQPQPQTTSQPQQSQQPIIQPIILSQPAMMPSLVYADPTASQFGVPSQQSGLYMQSIMSPHPYFMQTQSSSQSQAAQQSQPIMIHPALLQSERSMKSSSPTATQSHKTQHHPPPYMSSSPSSSSPSFPFSLFSQLLHPPWSAPPIYDSHPEFNPDPYSYPYPHHHDQAHYHERVPDYYHPYPHPTTADYRKDYRTPPPHTAPPAPSMYGSSRHYLHPPPRSHNPQEEWPQPQLSHRPPSQDPPPSHQSNQAPTQQQDQGGKCSCPVTNTEKVNSANGNTDSQNECKTTTTTTEPAPVQEEEKDCQNKKFNIRINLNMPPQTSRPPSPC